MLLEQGQKNAGQYIVQASRGFPTAGVHDLVAQVVIRGHGAVLSRILIGVANAKWSKLNGPAAEACNSPCASCISGIPSGGSHAALVVLPCSVLLMYTHNTLTPMFWMLDKGSATGTSCTFETPLQRYRFVGNLRAAPVRKLLHQPDALDARAHECDGVYGYTLLVDEVDAVWDYGESGPLVIDSLLRDRVLHICAIGTSPGDESWGFHHVDLKREGVPGPLSTRGWTWDVTDDVGTNYEAPSGAHGQSSDGSRIEGSWDIYPLPPHAANRLEIIFSPWDADNAMSDSQFVLRIPLPLREMTPEEWAKAIRRCRNEETGPPPAHTGFGFHPGFLDRPASRVAEPAGGATNRVSQERDEDHRFKR